MIARSRAPLRLGLAGGGTDVSPFCDEFGGFVLGATINKYAYAMIESKDDGRVRFVATDNQSESSHDSVPFIEHDGLLDLHKGVYNRIVRDFNAGSPLSIKVTTFCEAPPGSGLGSSSALVVAMVKAYVEYMNLGLGEYEIAHLAYEIERIDVGLNGGKQDQYTATFGGVSFIEFYADDRVVVNPLRVKNWILSELEASLLLYYTGVSRSSAAIIDEQTANVISHSGRSIEALHLLKVEAVNMKESILRGDIAGFAESLRLGWQSKKLLAHNITNPVIDGAYDAAIGAGARAGKVSGAGGGGFMMFFVDPTKRMDVVRALAPLGGEVCFCHFTRHGTTGWRIP